MTTNPQSRRPDPQNPNTFTITSTQQHQLDPHTLDYILKKIDQRIRQHEIRVAIISSIIGIPITIGIFHAIYLLNHHLPS